MWSEWEIWREINEASKKKKEQNYLRSKALLDENKIEYIEKANWYFMIWNFDFWITTWLFINRVIKKRGRGIFNLLKKISCQK